MIILINGAFGVGKTTVSTALQKRLSNSMIFDPEEVGFMLRNVISDEQKRPEERTDDFQDLHCWKMLVIETARALKNVYQQDIIMPMTIYNPDYLQYIWNGLQTIDQHTFHFCLTATKQTIHERLLARGEQEGNWCFQQTDKCLRAFHDQAFGQFIKTDGKHIDDIVKEIQVRLKR